MKTQFSINHPYRKSYISLSISIKQNFTKSICKYWRIIWWISLSQKNLPPNSTITFRKTFHALNTSDFQKKRLIFCANSNQIPFILQQKKFITMYYSVWNINDGKFLSHFLSICINFDISYFILFYLHICHPSSLYSDDKFSLFFPFTIFVPVSWFCANKLMNFSILIKIIESV